MPTRLRYELVAILVIAVAAFLEVFQPIRLIRAKEQLAHVYATYTLEKPLSHTRRAREALRREIVSKLSAQELFGVQVSFPTQQEVRIRLEVMPEEAQRDVEAATQALKEVLKGRFGEVRGPVVDTSGLPDRPLFQVGSVGLFPLRFHVRRGLDLQGGTHLVLQIRRQTARLEFELAPDDEKALQRIQTLSLEALAGSPASQEPAPPSTSQEQPPQEAKEIQLEEAQLKLEDALRILLPRSGLKDYYFEAVGVRVVVVYTMARGEQERGQEAQRILAALSPHFPQARLLKHEGMSLPENALIQAMETVRRRVDRLGVAEALVQTQGMERIVVQLPGIKDPEEAVRMLGTTAQLELRKIPEKYEVQVEKDPSTGKETVRFLEKQTNREVPVEIVYYEGEAVITGRHLKPGSAQVGYDQFGAPEVYLELTPEGARLFDQFAARNYGKHLGIYLDRQIISAPVIQARHFGGRVRITGGFENVKEARDLQALLNAGALPVPVDVVEQRSVSPTLGSDSVRQSFLAGLVGFALVASYMLFFYRVPGLLADVALVLYAIVVLALLVGFNATLTLPGIAGFILSIGMAVDANVIIFERLKEELRSGKILRSAIEAGFARAWTAIVDGNVTTLLIAAVLYIMGTGPIKGFAITLSLGILVSLFSAVFVTKRFLQVVSLLPWGAKPALYGIR